MSYQVMSKEQFVKLCAPNNQVSKRRRRSPPTDNPIDITSYNTIDDLEAEQLHHIKLENSKFDDLTILKEKYKIPACIQSALPTKKTYREMPGKRAIGSLLNKCFPFDASTIIAGIRKSARWHSDPSYTYYRMPASQISNRWAVCRLFGIRFHAFVHYELHNEPLPSEFVSPTFLQFRAFRAQFLTPLGLKPKMLETLVECGSHYTFVDAVFENADGELFLFDWKTSLHRLVALPYTPTDSQFQEKKARAPFDAFDNNPSMKYAAQVNLQRALLEKNGRSITAAFIVRFDATGYEIVQVASEPMQSAIEAILSWFFQ